MVDFAEIMPAVKAGRTLQAVTLIEAPEGKADCIGQMLFLDGETVVGRLVDEEFSARVVEFLQKDEWRAPGVFTLVRDGEYRLFRDCWRGKASALVLGGGHISQALVDILALVDYEVTVADDRPEFANQARFPRATQVICDSFLKVLSNLNIGLFSAVIVVTRGHKHDLDCIRFLADRDISYIGMIGSQRRVRGIVEMLRDEGVSEAWLAGLRSPIGLDIGAETPAEIGLSIAAEIVAAERGAGGRPLSERRKEHCHG